jgi:hypothetical protein
MKTAANLRADKFSPSLHHITVISFPPWWVQVGKTSVGLRNGCMSDRAAQIIARKCMLDCFESCERELTGEKNTRCKIDS